MNNLWLKRYNQRKLKSPQPNFSYQPTQKKPFLLFESFTRIKIVTSQEITERIIYESSWAIISDNIYLDRYTLML